MSEITLVEAVNLALHHEMSKDPKVVLLGRMSVTMVVSFALQLA